jgi:hypothetical protein
VFARDFLRDLQLLRLQSFERFAAKLMEGFVAYRKLAVAVCELPAFADALFLHLSL